MELHSPRASSGRLDATRRFPQLDLNQAASKATDDDEEEEENQPWFPSSLHGASARVSQEVSNRATSLSELRFADISGPSEKLFIASRASERYPEASGARLDSDTASPPAVRVVPQQLFDPGRVSQQFSEPAGATEQNLDGIRTRDSEQNHPDDIRFLQHPVHKQGDLHSPSTSRMPASRDEGDFLRMPFSPKQDLSFYNRKESPRRKTPSPIRSKSMSRSPVGLISSIKVADDGEKEHIPFVQPENRPIHGTDATDRGRKRRDHSRSPDGRSTVRGTSAIEDGKRRHDISRSPDARYSRAADIDRRHRRYGRSRSRSPARRPGQGRSPHSRGWYVRSRSRSPVGRSYYHQSRYSPRRRSPPYSYRPRRDRPPRRPWSPPPNRTTGIGKPGNNLFIAGFSSMTTERDLEKKFSRFGRVTDVRIVRCKRSGDSRGFGFLSLEKDEDADAAIKALDQTEWNGRIVLVEKAKTGN